MKRTYLLMGAGLAALSLAACASTGSPVLSAQLTATKAFVVSEQAFDTVVQAADIAVDTGALPASTVQKIKTLADAGYADVKVGRTAIAAGDATTITAEQAALASLVTQIAALVPAKS